MAAYQKGRRRAIADYHASGFNAYGHADWLGTTRFGSTSTRAKDGDWAVAPFGEEYAGAFNSYNTFTTFQTSDITSLLWDFPMREYHSSQGRWISPDPAGLAAVNPMNPQTWNRYGYVGGSPRSNVDPLGLCYVQTSNPSGLSSDLNANYTIADNGMSCDMVTAQPWLTMSNFGCYYSRLCNVPQEFGGSKDTQSTAANNRITWVWNFTKSFFGGFELNFESGSCLNVAASGFTSAASSAQKVSSNVQKYAPALIQSLNLEMRVW